MKKLFIVESPNKAKTIQKYLGNDYVVMASSGHVRDLNPKALSVEIENNFKPIYEVNAETKYEYYFNQFFADGGEYTTYATFEDENRRARIVAKGKAQENWSTVIRVKRSELKQRLIDDGIIKP